MRFIGTWFRFTSESFWSCLTGSTQVLLRRFFLAMILANYVLIILWFRGDFMVVVPSWCPCFKKCNTMSAFHRIRSFGRILESNHMFGCFIGFSRVSRSWNPAKSSACCTLPFTTSSGFGAESTSCKAKTGCILRLVSQEKLRPFLQYKSFKHPYRSFWKPNLWISCGSTIATIPWKSASLTLTPSRNCFRIERNLPKYPHETREKSQSKWRYEVSYHNMI